MKNLVICAALLGGTALIALPGAAQAGVTAVPAGWTCTGNCGSDTADGDIPLSPINNPTYQFVSTNNAPTGVGINPLGATSPTNGSLLQTAAFNATANTQLSFYFDFITSDGGQFADNSWAALFTAGGTLVSELYNSTAGVTPLTVGASTVSWLGNSSGKCFDNACGNTGWQAANYTITTGGSYYMEFGTTNAMDTSFDTGLAIDGVAVNGVQINPVPEPASIMLLGGGLLGFGAIRRRRSR